MISFDFSTYIDSSNIDYAKKQQLLNKLLSDSKASFINNIITDSEINSIIEIANKIKNNSDVLLVVGIGGSYMGSFAINNIFAPIFKKNGIEVIYIGNNLSSKYLMEVLDYIKDKEVSVSVISKSGNTLEVNLVYDLVKSELLKKYSDEELEQRIIIITGIDGRLSEEANEYNYRHLLISNDIVGRYSIMSVAHLLPLSVNNIDIKSFKKGFEKGLKLTEEAYTYSFLRLQNYKNGKYIENFSVYESELYYYAEWLKQLFGESEGKNGKGVFPVSTVNTRDLHSLGQFIEEGNNIFFETVIKVKKNNWINDLNNKISNAVSRTHFKSNTPNIVITIENLDIEAIGELSAFFMLSAAFSAYLFDVNPFDQPGVEKYKNEIKKDL